MQGRFNVSYNDLNELAYPVLRHRMKLNFEAIAQRVEPDEIIKMIIKELGGKKATIKADNDEKTKEEQQQPAEDIDIPQETETKKAKKGLFGRK